MSSNYQTRRITSLVTTVARKVATQQSPIAMATVISRNSDGSLNVDDGQGGCLRQSPKANVRVGEKIVLGVEPGIGQQTDLPLVTIVLAPSDTPCPGDPRGCIPSVGVFCDDQPPEAPPEEGETVFDRLGDYYSFAWSSSAEIPGFPGADGEWEDRLLTLGESDSADGFLYTNNQVCFAQGIRRASNYSVEDPSFGPFAGRSILGVCRTVFEFDTSSIPDDVILDTVTLTIIFRGNEISDMRNDNLGNLVFVPFVGDGVVDTVANYYAFDPVQLCNTPIQTIIEDGPFPLATTPFSFEFFLTDPDTDLAPDLYINRTGITRFMALIELDFDPESASYPVPSPFTNLGDENEMRVLADIVGFFGPAPASLRVTFHSPV